MVLIKKWKDTVVYRNVRLFIDKYFLELNQKRDDRRLSLDYVLNSLLEDHYSQRTKD